MKFCEKYRNTWLFLQALKLVNGMNNTSIYYVYKTLSKIYNFNIYFKLFDIKCRRFNYYTNYLYTNEVR